ncbi:MAG TPA: DUF4062 domain-containing protein [Candidatus Margulisiibacteriota bacterium]|nr:DUF4062 domain-containing protein [Candidatus Margulisiibacteriota bacterium]
MPKPLRKIVIFVASPGDVQSERGQLAKVVDELNLTLTALAPEKGLFVELVRWETHATPGLGRDAQDVVNRQIPTYDIFIGIMWKRFGTPTAVAGSGTAEEFQNAYARWRKNSSLPVLFYFCQKPLPPPRTAEEVKQLGQVVAFHEELSAKGLVWEYDVPETFSEIARPHLLRVLGQIATAPGSPSDAAERSKSLAEKGSVRAQRAVGQLAEEYERLRREMPPGDPRTRAMAAVFSRMRSIALSIYPLVKDLADSQSAGRRLAAIAILREIPNESYLEWLADRPALEPHFPGFQAMLALQNAARVLVPQAKRAVEAAVARAETKIDALEEKDPNQVAVLEETKRMLGVPAVRSRARTQPRHRVAGQAPLKEGAGHRKDAGRRP